MLPKTGVSSGASLETYRTTLIKNKVATCKFEVELTACDICLITQLLTMPSTAMVMTPAFREQQQHFSSCGMLTIVTHQVKF